MTIRELIQELEAMAQAEDNAAGDEATVYITRPTHDHWRTTKVEPAIEVGTEVVEHSDYHDALVVKGSGDEDEMVDPDKQSMVLVIR